MTRTRKIVCWTMLLAVICVCSPADYAWPPEPDCGPNFLWDCTMPDGSHEFVDATRCEIRTFQQQTGASCVLA